MKSAIIRSVAGRGVPVRGNDIDTDRIIPARYLKEVTFDRMGDYPFYDERFDEKGNEKDHPFNRKEYQGAAILFVNENFGCGSSREHAPQALMRWGIKAVVGESFAEIFAGNCTMLGIPAVTAPRAALDRLQNIVEEAPETSFTIDIDAGRIQWPGGDEEMLLPAAKKSAFLNGTWDTTSMLLENLEKTKAVESSLPYSSWKR